MASRRCASRLMRGETVWATGIMTQTPETRLELIVQIKEGGVKKLTAKEIDAARSPKGGFTKETLVGWGIPWPPPKGWRQMSKMIEAGEEIILNSGLRPCVAERFWAADLATSVFQAMEAARSPKRNLSPSRNRAKSKRAREHI